VPSILNAKKWASKKRARYRHEPMATHAAKLIARSATQERARPMTVCHFTTAHSELKSRSFHREFMPLAANGFGVQYVAPMKSSARRDGVDLIALPRRGNRVRALLVLPALVAKLLRQRAGLYHFQDPQLLPIAFALKLLFRKRVVYDAYEDFPSMTANKASLPHFLRPLAAKLMAGLENLAARCFDGVMTADPFTLRRFARSGHSRKLVFYNFPNLDLFPPIRPRAKSFDVVYRGGLSERAGTFLLLEAVRLLAARASPVRLLLIGYFDSSSAETALRERIRIFGLDSLLEIRGRIAHEDMADALSEARIGVCPLQPVPKFLLNIPVKVFEYWACGLPVVASDLPPIRPFFRNEHAGFLVPPKSAVALARSMGWLLDHPEDAARMGERGRDLVTQRFNNGCEVHKLHRFCAQIAGGVTCSNHS
jgi:glycosyltransferase involved in cell wall biosynthesis